MASRKEYEMLFALEAQLGKEFHATFQQARNELGQTGDCAETFGNQGVQAVDAFSSAIAAAGVTAILHEIRTGLAECTQASMDFETAITGVAKTTDLTDDELAAMSDSIKELSTDIPATTDEISAVAEAAGQLGIQKDALLDFTEIMTMLGTATNMTADDAATALARFANITGMSEANYGRLGSVIVDLGNNFATTESEITAMGTRLASAGRLAGLSEAQIMALAASMSSVGIEAEAGGTAMTQTLNAIEKAVAGGGETLAEFARIAGMSSDTFAAAWENDAMQALSAFIAGLGALDTQGESAVLVLEDLGLTGIRQSNMLKSLALAADQMEHAVETANTAWDKNIALTAEAEKRYSTTESKLTMMQNAYNNVEIAIGDVFTPALREVYDVGIDVLGNVEDYIAQNPGLVRGVTVFTGAVGLATAGLTAYAAIAKAVKALDMATVFAGPVGWIVKGTAAVAGLAAGLFILSDDGVPSVRELTEAAREMNETLAESKAAYEDTADSAIAAASVADTYIDRLEAMEAAGQASSEAGSEYQNTLATLVAVMPGLSDVISSTTDEFGRTIYAVEGSTSALHENTAALRENAIQQASQDYLTELYKKHADVLIEQQQNSIKLQKAREDLSAAETEYNAILARMTELADEAAQKAAAYAEQTGGAADTTAFLTQEYYELQAGLSAADKEIVRAQGTVDNLNRAMQDDAAAAAAATEEIALAEEAVSQFAGTAEDSTGPVGDLAAEMGSFHDIMDGVTEQAETLAEAYSKAYDAAYTSVTGQYALWDSAASVVATSAYTINSAIDSQLTYWQNYNANLQSLSERSTDIAGLSDMIASFADGSKESVNAIAGMASASDSDLAAMVTNWQLLQQEQEKTTTQLAELKTDFSSQMDELQSEFAEDVAALNLSEEAIKSARQTVQGFIDGASGMLPDVELAFASIGAAALRGFGGNQPLQKPGAARDTGTGVTYNAYAAGTDYAMPGAAIVGEDGPELMLMRGGERVLNAHDTSRVMQAVSAPSGDTSGAGVQVTFNISGSVDERTMAQLQSYGEEFAERVRAVVHEENENARRMGYD